MSDDPTDREDPFDRLDSGGDREGDPFERLDDEGSSGKDGEWPEPAPREAGSVNTDDAAPYSAVTDDGSAHPTQTDGTADPSDPFANVDTPTGSPFDGPESVFERVDSGGADPDQVWESITGTDDGDGQAEPSVPDESRYTDVSKHRFCERCEHFSSPPDVSCGHDTAEIIEFLDVETVRLLDCPVVAEREALERRD